MLDERRVTNAPMRTRRLERLHGWGCLARSPRQPIALSSTEFGSFPPIADIGLAGSLRSPEASKRHAHAHGCLDHCRPNRAAFLFRALLWRVLQPPLKPIESRRP